MARKMKDSGIDWIGSIPENWTISRTKNYYTNHKYVVGDKAAEYERLALTLNGVIKRPKDDSTGLQPEEFSGYQILSTDELVFKLIDLQNISTSRVGLSPYTGIVSPAYIILHKKEGVDSKYGEYFFLSMWQREIFNQMGDDGVRSSLNTSDLLNIPYTFPPLPEQQKIATFLDKQCTEIDTVLTKTRESIEEYKLLKNAIITQAVTKGIRPNRKMKDSGIEWIGKIPEEWRTPKLKYLCSMQAGKNLDANNILPEGMYPVYGGNDIRGYYINYNVDGKFLLVGRQGALCGNVHRLNKKIWATEHAVITHNKKNTNVDYLYYLLIGMNLGQYVNSVAAQPGLSVSTIQNITTCLPSFDEQTEIAKYLDEKCSIIDNLVTKKETIICELETYRKSLIYEYVTGKKEVQHNE